MRDEALEQGVATQEVYMHHMEGGWGGGGASDSQYPPHMRLDVVLGLLNPAVPPGGYWLKVSSLSALLQQLAMRDQSGPGSTGRFTRLKHVAFSHLVSKRDLL